MRINQILENEYNQETIDKLGDLKSKVEDEEREINNEASGENRGYRNINFA